MVGLVPFLMICYFHDRRHIVQFSCQDTEITPRDRRKGFSETFSQHGALTLLRRLRMRSHGIPRRHLQQSMDGCQSFFLALHASPFFSCLLIYFQTVVRRLRRRGRPDHPTTRLLRTATMDQHDLPADAALDLLPTGVRSVPSTTRGGCTTVFRHVVTLYIYTMQYPRTK